MVDKIKKLNVENLSIYLLVFTTFGLIGTKTIDISGVQVLVEIVGVASVFFITVQLIKILKGKYDLKDYYNENKIIIISFVIYIVVSVIRMSVGGIGDLIYELNYNLPYILFLFLLLYFKNIDSKMKKKIFNFTTYIFIISLGLALLFFILGYTNAGFSLDNFIKLVSFEECKNSFGEIRLYWLLSHKSRFTVYCYIAYIFLVRNKDINNKIKYFGIGLSAICVILSNSMIGIAIYVALVFIYFIEKYNLIHRVRESKKAKIVLLVIFIIGLIASIILFVIISEKRNLSTLGSRTFIWAGGVEVIKNNIFGIGAMPSYSWLPARYKWVTLHFTNAHNVYLNRIIEIGIIPGILFIACNIAIIINFIKKKDLLFTCMLIFTLLGYSLFESLNINELPYMIFISYCIFFYKKELELK